MVVGWHLSREVRQVVYGMYRITRLPNPTASIFGGSHLGQKSFYAQSAGKLAEKIVDAGIAVLTGGGPGIMEAANCGAVKNRKNTDFSMAIGISNMKDEEGLNPCVGEHLILDYFFSRKWLLINYSMAFVVFPGGFGTMDELSDLLNLMVTGRRPVAPVVLIGTHFWRPYLDWIDEATEQGFMPGFKELNILVTDDIDEAVQHVVSFCKSCRSRNV